MMESRRIHLIGIGGTGLSAIARLLQESGQQVSGSDRQPSPLAKELEALGVRVYIGHAAPNVVGADVVIRSSAVPDENPEVQEAIRLGIPVLKRADFLGELMAAKTGIAIAGAHGKTTTTAMVSWMLTALGQDPSFIIGGISHNLGVNARAGNGSYFVIEADEYDRMFHGLKPAVAVVTNIEHDHPDCYPTAEDFYQAFTVFARSIPGSGQLIVCLDDPGAARLAQEMTGSVSMVTYGIDSAQAEYQALQVHANALGGFSFLAAAEGQQALVNLQVPGLHNVRNALAALAVAGCCGLDLQQAADALGEFRGAGRRFDLRGEVHGITVVDDYGHHPTEIRATLAAARSRYPGRKIWAVWQPHTFSRTRTLLRGFATAFVDADSVLVTDVYASREQPPADGFSAVNVVKAIEHPQVLYTPTLQQAQEMLLGLLKPGDVIIVFSAGDADQISRHVVNTLEERMQLHD
jgi:UDP-N-acetylmuramate--alanine ligase